MAACIILAVPLWLVALPPMQDYPAHLASYYLIGGGASPYYDIHWAFIPNLAGEIIVPLLAKLLPLGIAAKLFLTAAIAMWVMGPALIHRALHGRFGLGALAAAAFAYNANFFFGFANYVFAAGASFVVFAAWIATAGRPGAARLTGFAAAITAVYFCHLFAAATLMVMIATYELATLWPADEFAAVLARLARVVVIALPATLCFVLLRPHGLGFSGLDFDLAATMASRLLSAVQLCYSRPDYAVLAALVLLFVFGAATGRLRIADSMRFPLIVLAGCALVAPEWATGVWGVHLRLPAVVGALAFASCELDVPQRWRAPFVAACLAAFTFQAAAAGVDWRSYDPELRAFRAAVDRMPERARVLTVLDEKSPRDFVAAQPYWHWAALAIIDRKGFTPTMFAFPGQHIVRAAPAMSRFAAKATAAGSPPPAWVLQYLAKGKPISDRSDAALLANLELFQCHFDRVVVIHDGGRPTRLPPVLRLQATGSFYSIYATVPDGHCSAHR